jgi:excisionase family DNA binding protein
VSNNVQSAYPPLLTVDEAAEYLRISRRQVYNLLAAGELPHVRVGSRVRFDREALRAALEARDDREAVPT